MTPISVSVPPLCTSPASEVEQKEDTESKAQEVSELESPPSSETRTPFWKTLAGNVDEAHETKRAMASRHLMMIGASLMHQSADQRVVYIRQSPQRSVERSGLAFSSARVL